VSFLEQLNPNQKQAVLTKSRYVRIIAGAGSGKTRVLTTRIAHLIQDLGVASNSIVAITFTNKAANEMKSRMYNMLGDMAAGIHLSTIASGFYVKTAKAWDYRVTSPSLTKMIRNPS
jgi:DNA helicase-2/ATP-dependent DNA helicase PcrA